ncbi:unnamed protein product [Parascedosporium putredinis]|uniref:LysM domain-containing protein n=1 Tax=Parascedosporium putredinis TaxID=1442378 RepID=A0A9P1H2U1_9PEZI|nr:unnamed protein product [Parascedosporium putredinis]CAI7993931.1 unnamed protein product [Parascedosporium putredinis]
MTDCSEYFTVKTGDTCSTISEVNDTYWEWPTQFASTTVSLATPTMPVTPNDFPLAPGTLDNCFTYEMYREPLWERVSAKRYNSCGTISSFYGCKMHGYKLYHDFDIELKRRFSGGRAYSLRNPGSYPGRC